MGKEAPTRVWRTLKNQPETPRLYPGENREPLKTLEQKSAPWGRVERDQEIGNVTGGCGWVIPKWRVTGMQPGASVIGELPVLHEGRRKKR